MRRFITTAALAVVAAMFGASSAFAAQAAPQGDPAKGKANFERVGCYQCHGHLGQGGREGPRIADPVPLAWPAFQAWVRTTSGDMPPYTAKVLSDQELVDIYAHLQSIPKSPDYKTIPLLSQMTTTAANTPAR
jgi:ubiquinol-cytochrome c reductase cytochrome c subunit